MKQIKFSEAIDCKNPTTKPTHLIIQTKEGIIGVPLSSDIIGYLYCNER